MNENLYDGYPPEYVKKILEDYKRSFAPVEAEREYRDMLENGGITWEQLVLELDDIDRKNQPGSM